MMSRAMPMKIPSKRATTKVPRKYALNTSQVRRPIAAASDRRPAGMSRRIQLQIEAPSLRKKNNITTVRSAPR